MKALLLTTALALVTAGGAYAQTATTQAPTPAPGDAPMVNTAAGTLPGATATVPGFRASAFTGMTLYTLSPEVVTELRAAQPADPAWDERTARWTSGETFIAGRDQWENIGSINDVVLSQDGEVRGVLLDVGGFLGIGARTVMVDTDDLYFVTETATPEDLGDFFVVASLSREALEALPEWSDDNLIAGYTYEDEMARADMAHGQPGTTAAPLTEGATLVAPTAEELTGATVYDPTGESIGSVSDLVLSGDTVSDAVINVGGFLGIGSRSVLVPVDTLTIIRNDDQSIERIETSLTREQLEALPEFAG